MTSDLLRVLALESKPSEHERIRAHAVATGLQLQFEWAETRAQFEAALERGGFDLIVADHHTPGYDGIEALRAARARRPAVPYVIVSRSIGEDRAAECLHLGASDFVHKDRLERLPSALARALRSSADPGGREIEQLFRGMAENIRDVFWVGGADSGRVSYVSPAYASLWGRPADTLLAGQALWPEAVFPDDREAVDQARARLARGLPYSLEYRIQHADGGLRWIHDRGFPLPGDTGRGSRALGVASDVTERKRLESELLQAQKMELVGRLAGGVAHDFNNLLTIISGYVSMLLDKEGNPPASAEALKRVFTASQQATGLVRQLLLFSRKRAPLREAVDLNAEVEQMCAMLGRLLGETISVQFEPCPGSPRITADVGMLEQALMNLAVNARDAMPRGGILKVEVGFHAREPGPQAQRSLHTGDFATLLVRDTGSGIPPAILPRIFEPFFTTKGEGRGTGLGLATVQDILKRHDGWVEVDTEVGRGTAFRLFLPIAKAEAATDPGGSREAGARPRRATILLVEDEANVREFAAAVLQQEGYTLLQARSGENALEVWRWHAQRVDLLLTDVVLPGDLSGPELGARLRAEKASLKVILTTGYGRETLDEQAGGSRGAFVLGKPYTPRMLLHAVQEVLG